MDVPLSKTRNFLPTKRRFQPDAKNRKLSASALFVVSRCQKPSDWLASKISHCIEMQKTVRQPPPSVFWIVSRCKKPSDQFQNLPVVSRCKNLSACPFRGHLYPDAKNRQSGFYAEHYLVSRCKKPSRSSFVSYSSCILMQKSVRIDVQAKMILTAW